MEMINNVEGIKKFKEEKFSKIFDIEKAIFNRMLKLLRNMQNWNLMARYSMSSGYRYIYQETFKNREEVLKFLKGKTGK